MSVEFIDNSGAAKQQMERNIGKALTMMGIKWQEIATKEATATGVVDTGRLRASLSYITPDTASGRNMSEPKPGKDGKPPYSSPSDALGGNAPDNTLIVGTNVEYAPYVHEGTSRMDGRPFISDAVMNYKDDYNEICFKELGEDFGGFK